VDKVWLKEYPQGVDAEIQLDAYKSLSELLEHSCQRFAELPAYSNMGSPLSYRRLNEDSRAFAAFLRREHGLARGERVALMLPNLLQYPVALFGVLRAGLVVVNVNPQYTERELEHQLRDSGATAIVVLENFAGTLERTLPKTSVKLVITTQVGDLFPAPKAWLVNLSVKYLKHMVPAWHIPGAIGFNQALRIGRGLPPVDERLTHADVALLQYTGGTTGVAKGAVLTHGNVLANALQMHAWIAPWQRDGREIAVIPLPLYHVYAMISSLVFNTFGACCVLITNPRDLRGFVKTLMHLRFTAIIGVNTLYNTLIAAPGFDKVDLSQLKLISAGGMAISRSVAHKWKERTGVPIIEGYGLSETSPVVISNALNIRDWTGVIGLPIPSTEAVILDEAGQPVPQGEVGEICVRGPQVMKGYWNRPEATAEAFTSDGWLRTGDMGSMDERGYFKVTDRKKDMIIVSGFKVFPNEIEDVLMLHPGVLEACVIGVPDQRSGECVKAILVTRDASLTQEELFEHCKKHLTGYKLPKLIELRQEPLPKSPIGKILRRELRSSLPAPQPTAA
jgi:long-chain acyl-CoA synthetase